MSETTIEDRCRGVLVLCNTLYMDAALAHLRRTGAEVKPEDMARLSPLGHEHINVLA